MDRVIEIIKRISLLVNYIIFIPLTFLFIYAGYNNSNKSYIYALICLVFMFALHKIINWIFSKNKT